MGSKSSYFARMSVFRYAADLIVIISAFVYSFFAANYLGPEKYGLISYLMAFIGGLPFLFGFELFNDVLKVYVARFKSSLVVRKVALFASIFLVIVFIACMLMPNQLVMLMGKGDKDTVVMLSLLIFIVPVLPLFQSVFIGFKQFGKLLKLVVVEKVLDLVFLFIYLFVLKFDYMSLFFAMMSSMLVVMIISAAILSRAKLSPAPVPSKEIRSFAVQAGTANFAKGASAQAETWVLGSMLGMLDFGVFYLIRRIAVYVYETPQTAMSEVFLPFLSEEKSKEKLLSYTSTMLKFQLLLNLALSLFMLAAVPIIVVMFFPAYVSGLPVIPILVLGLFFSFSHPMSRLLKVINRNSAITVTFIASLITTLIAGFLLIPAFGLFGAATVFSLNRVVPSITTYVYCAKYGYRLSFVPKKNDLRFFASSLKKMVLFIFTRK